MSFSRYPQYKDSGVEWLGEVPAHWEVTRLKRAASVFPSNVDKKTVDDEVPVRLCNYTDVYYNDLVSADMDLMSATAKPEQIEKFTLRGGDTIITKDSETADDIAVSAYVPVDLPGVVCGYHLSVIRPTADTSGAFVKRLFDSLFIKASVAVRANGLTRVGLGQYALDNLEIPFPPQTEQSAIATFLDRETAKIDALVAEQRRLIALLQEKRQAVISHAVTKGLNPDAPMKDSGVEWLGEVPAHWEVKQLRHVVGAGDGIQMGPFGGMLLGLSDTETGYKLYGQENTISGDFTRGDRWLSYDRYLSLSQYALRVGDLVLTRKGSLGSARLVTALPHPGVVDSDTIRLRVNERDISSSFVALLLHEAWYISHQIALNKRGAILAGLNSQTISNLIVAIPPRAEQEEIIEYQIAASAALTSLSADAARVIELFLERRSALISAAVTGQIDVRALADAEAA